MDSLLITKPHHAQQSFQFSLNVNFGSLIFSYGKVELRLKFVKQHLMVAEITTVYSRYGKELSKFSNLIHILREYHLSGANSFISISDLSMKLELGF